MKKIFVSYPVDWIKGHLRYGHREGEIELTDTEFMEFISNPEAFIAKDPYSLSLLVDDWEIDDYDDDIHDVEWRIVN